MRIYCGVCYVVRGFQSARIRTAGLAMLRPRASRMIASGSPGQRGGPVGGQGPARAKTCRAETDNQVAGNRGCADAENLACAASACMGCGVGGAAFATAWCCNSEQVAAAGAPKPWTMPGTAPGFSHQYSPVGAAPARNPFRLPPNATMARDSSGQSGCPGPTPWRRHIQAIERPNWPRTDAASDCAEPAGRSGRSRHHACIRQERRRRTACACSRRKRISMARQRTSHSGNCPGASRSASGA